MASPNFVQQIALVASGVPIPTDRLMMVVAALQLQLMRDFSPLWGISATISSCPSVENLSAGVWPIVIRNDLDNNLKGYHTTQSGQPFALVQFEGGWEAACSHECLEMLADPYGSLLRPGPTLLPGTASDVEYLVEICDPCAPSTYPVNGVMLSNFVTPQYYDRVATSSARYDFVGSITAPRAILEAGYVTFHDPSTGHWHQIRRLNGALASLDMGTDAPADGAMREGIDALTRHRRSSDFQPVTGAVSSDSQSPKNRHFQNALKSLLATRRQTRAKPRRHR